MLGKKRRKNPYWGHTAKNSGQKRDFAILEILEFEYFPFGPFAPFGSDPGFEQWWPSHHCSEHISDPKGPNGKFMNSTPPFWDFSRESWGGRSEPLPLAYIFLGPSGVGWKEVEVVRLRAFSFKVSVSSAKGQVNKSEMSEVSL